MTKTVPTNSVFGCQNQSSCTQSVSEVGTVSSSSSFRMEVLYDFEGKVSAYIVTFELHKTFEKIRLNKKKYERGASRRLAPFAALAIGKVAGFRNADWHESKSPDLGVKKCTGATKVAAAVTTANKHMDN